MKTSSDAVPAPSYPRTIVVVEDDGFLRSLLADSLESAGFLVSTAANASDAKRVINLVDPDAVILDVDLGRGPTGFDIADRLRAQSDEVGILFLTSLPDPRFAGRDQSAVYKNAAYLNKNMIEDSTTVLNALNAVLTGRDVARYRHNELGDRPFAQLSNTQVQVLRLLAEGKTNQQIADARQRSLGGTESAITRTLEALGIDAQANINVRVAAANKFSHLVKSSDPES
jgi:DNA-binding NarL/FixJ family response regulator